MQQALCEYGHQCLAGAVPRGVAQGVVQPRAAWLQEK